MIGDWVNIFRIVVGTGVFGIVSVVFVFIVYVVVFIRKEVEGKAEGVVEVFRLGVEIGLIL